MLWKTRRRTLDLTLEPLIAGIVNVTPDSFSDGGKHNKVRDAVKYALKMIGEGAHMVDIGGESSKPGSDPVSSVCEVERVVPVIRGIRAQSDCVISIDTYKADVAEKAILAGADIVNDISGFKDEKMVAICSEHKVGMILMHMQGDPKTMQKNPYYKDVVYEVKSFFKKRYKELTQNFGIDGQQLCFDPGIGFGKTLEHNLELIKNLEVLAPESRPLLLGASRKRILGDITNEDDPSNRDVATAVLTSLVAQGQRAQIHRVHNVSLIKEALSIVKALSKATERV